MTEPVVVAVVGGGRCCVLMVGFCFRSKLKARGASSRD